jgi:hypothetical protein
MVQKSKAFDGATKFAYNQSFTLPICTIWNSSKQAQLFASASICYTLYKQLIGEGFLDSSF